MSNLITDVPGLRVGNAHDERIATGVTVAILDAPAVTSAFIPGGAPGGRDTASYSPEMTVGMADAIALSGGSALGLDAASGAQAWLRERGRGFPVRTTRVPLVPQAICFDLLNGGNKEWGRRSPYPDLAYAACEAAGSAFPLGSVGGGYGATTANLKGGLGSTSATTASGFHVGALAVVNAVGSAVVGAGPHFWAAPWERNGEFGRLGAKATLTDADLQVTWKGGPAPGTTIAIVATDAALSSGQARRLAIMASAGIARALRLVFAPTDGDTIFASATGARPLTTPAVELTEIGAVAADCLARAIACGVFEATPLPYPDALPAWREVFG